MEDVFDDIVSPADLQKFERAYNNQLQAGQVSKEAQFEYGYCLVRSKFPADVKKGIVLMEELFANYSENRRDYIYYLAIGYARIKEFAKSLHYCRNFLQIEPNNQQVLALESIVQDKLNRAGREGIALAAGGGLFAVGAAIVTGVLVSKFLGK